MSIAKRFQIWLGEKNWTFEDVYMSIALTLTLLPIFALAGLGVLCLLVCIFQVLPIWGSIPLTLAGIGFIMLLIGVERGYRL